MGKIEVIHLNVSGAGINYMDKVWVDDENHPEGGSFQTVLKRYPNPMINVDFLGRTEDDLLPGAVYIDGAIPFIATSRHEFRNMDPVMESFSVPQILVCVSNPYLEGTGQPQ